MPPRIPRSLSQDSPFASNYGSSLDSYHVPVAAEGASVHPMHMVLHDAPDALDATSRERRPLERDPLLPQATPRALAVAEYETVVPTRPSGSQPLGDAELARRRGACRGLVTAGLAASMVGAQMVWRVEVARPDNLLEPVLRMWRLPAAGRYGLEAGVAAGSLSARQALAALVPSSIWLTRLPDKFADGLAAWGAHAEGSSWADEGWLLSRPPGTAFPLACRATPPPLGCPEELGDLLAARNAPYLYAVNGILWGVVLGYVAGRVLWKPLVVDGVVAGARLAWSACLPDLREVAADVAQDLPTTKLGAAKLAVKWAIRRATRWAASVQTDTEAQGTPRGARAPYAAPRGRALAT